MLNQRIKPRFVWSSVLLLAVLVIALVGKDRGQATPIHGEPPVYTITLNSTNAPTTSTDSVAASQTARYTTFEYTSVRYSPGNHCVLDPMSRLFNSSTSQITSVSGVTATFSTDGVFKLRTTLDRFHYLDYPLTSGAFQELPSLPYFLEFTAEDFEVTLESIVMTYTCVPHEASPGPFTVNWYDVDGLTLLESDVDVASGTFPSYDGPLPTKAYDPVGETFYAFAGWNIAPTEVMSNQEYTAMFKPYTAVYSLISGDTAYALTSVSDNTLFSISIPSSYSGLPVTSIGNNALQGFASLSAIDLPSTLTHIGDGVFTNCTDLAAIVIPANVITLGVDPFGGCSSLASISVDPANTVYSSFEGVLFNEALSTLLIYPAGKGTSYTIPSGVTSLADGAFLRCGALASISIPASVTTLGENVFYACTSLDNVVIPDTVTTMGQGTFQACLSLSSVTLPSGMTSLPAYTFQGCTNLASMTLPGGLTTLEMYSFYGCSALTSMSFPLSVTSIGERAFYDCVLLGNVTLPTGLLTIGAAAFTNCDSFTGVNIPASVTSIGEMAFIDCSLLSTITVAAGNTTYSSYNGSLFNDDLTTLMCYPSGITDASYTIPASVTTIVSYAISDNPHLTSIHIPLTVTTIGANGVYHTDNVIDIYCEPATKPDGWDANWTFRHTIWGGLYEP